MKQSADSEFASQSETPSIKPVAALSTHDTPAQWSTLCRLLSDWMRLGRCSPTMGREPCLQLSILRCIKKLAHSQHSLASIEHRLGQLAEAGVRKVYQMMLAAAAMARAATALTTVASALDCR